LKKAISPGDLPIFSLRVGSVVVAAVKDGAGAVASGGGGVVFVAVAVRLAGDEVMDDPSGESGRPLGESASASSLFGTRDGNSFINFYIK